MKIANISPSVVFSLQLLEMTPEEAHALHAWIYKHLGTEPLDGELAKGQNLAGAISNELNKLLMAKAK